MPLRIFRGLNSRRRRLAAISALATIALFSVDAPSASAATPLTGEGLSGTGKSTGGSSSGLCPHAYFPTGGAAGFRVTGTATGPYPGSFTETGSASLFAYGGTNTFYATFNATFTITSRTTTIKGSVAGTRTSLGTNGFICNSAHQTAEFKIYGLPVTYTATIDGQTSQGTGTVSGIFYIATGGQDTVSESLQ